MSSSPPTCLSCQTEIQPPGVVWAPSHDTHSSAGRCPQADGADRSSLTVNNVKFVDNPRALSLHKMKGIVRNSQFVGHKKRAVVVKADEARPGDTGNWDVKFVSCLFSGNQASGDQARTGGGAILVDFAGVTIDKCTFQKNSADTSGGALRFIDANGKISGSTFVSNKAKNIGGAIVMRRSGVQVTTSSFKENVATNGGGALAGGNDGFVATFDRCSFTKNKALAGFGGVLQFSDSGLATFCKCTFLGNTGKNSAPSNVYALGEGSTIATNPEIVIPFVSAAPGGSVTFEKGRC